MTMRRVIGSILLVYVAILYAFVVLVIHNTALRQAILDMHSHDTTTLPPVKTLISYNVLKRRKIDVEYTNATTNRHTNDDIEMVTSQARQMESNIITSSSISSSENIAIARTAALLNPPGLFGGYRNQVLRFSMFCLLAKHKQVKQLLLPSLQWQTPFYWQENVTDESGSEEIQSYSTYRKVPMDHIFDIEYWNSMTPNVPELVSISEGLSAQSDCWDTSDWTAVAAKNATLPLDALQTMALQQGGLTPVMNEVIATTMDSNLPKLRANNYYPAVAHCRDPIVFGGGTHAGYLWTLTSKMTRKNRTDELRDINRHVLSALRPAQVWRDVADQCIKNHLPNGGDYIALHARVELDMISHVCGRENERSLDRIFNLTAEISQQYPTVSGIFVAVSRPGMLGEMDSNLRKKYKDLAKTNNKTLNMYIGSKDDGIPGELLGPNKLRVFECGENMLQQYYKQQRLDGNTNVIDYGGLLESVLNFYLAVNARVFVGVRNSSYSTDIIATRHYLGKTNDIYRITKANGVEHVTELPATHSNCKTAAKARKEKQEREMNAAKAQQG